MPEIFTDRVIPTVMFANCGHFENSRNIKDCRDLNFISAGHGRDEGKTPYFFSNQIRNLIIGDILCVYRKPIGYVGIARVVSKPMNISNAFLSGKKVTPDTFVYSKNMFTEMDEPKGYEECMVEIKWLTPVHISDEVGSGACFGRPYFANPSVTCSLDNQQLTKDKLADIFKINFEQLLLKNEIELWVDDEMLAEEITNDISEQLFEGAKKSIVINAYERNPKARKVCIEHWKAICAVCDFDFEKMYGEIGKGFIHVHHLKPLSEIGEQYDVDPINDLRPVCPNCHSMLHRQMETLSIEKLKIIIAAHQ